MLTLLLINLFTFVELNCENLFDYMPRKKIFWCFMAVLVLAGAASWHWAPQPAPEPQPLTAEERDSINAQQQLSDAMTLEQAFVRREQAEAAIRDDEKKQPDVEAYRPRRIRTSLEKTRTP